MSNFDTTKTQLSRLLDEIESGKLQLPDFQRGWVWRVDLILSLLVSIARSFPVGAVMLLETGGDAKFRPRRVKHVDSTVPVSEPEKLILDGQQRLTSLAQVLTGSEATKTYDQSNNEIERFFYIDINSALDDPTLENAFIDIEKDRMMKTDFGRKIQLDLSTRKNECEQFYFPCNQILNSDDWEESLQEYNQDNFSNYMRFRRNVLSGFRNYQVPVISLDRNTSKEAVCLVFEKVNTAGEKLTVFELVTASYAVDDYNLRDDWYGLEGQTIGRKKRLEKKSAVLKSVEPTEFLQAITLLHTYEKRNKDIIEGKTGKAVTPVSVKRADVLDLKLSDFKRWADEVEEGYIESSQFLEELCFLNHKHLPYRTQLVPLSAILAKIKDRWREYKVKKKLHQWYWCGVFGELYGGAVETRMANDVQEVLDWIENDGEELLPRTITDSSFQQSRLLYLRSKRSAAYKGISTYILFKGSKDFYFNADVKQLTRDEKKIDIHHIFPKAWCLKQSKAVRHFDTIVNKTPISAKANRKIGGRPPSKYLGVIEKQAELPSEKLNEILRTHYINPEALRTDDYEDFFTKRIEQLCFLIHEATGKKVESDLD